MRRRIVRLVKRHGIDLEQPRDEGDPTDGRLFECPMYAEIQSAAVVGRVATGPRAGAAVVRVGRDLYAAQITASGPLHAHLEGFDLHAAVAVPAGDRARLEHLCRYVLRPPLAQERLDLTPDGKVLLRLRRPWSDGTRAIRFEPSELLEKLAAMIPKPRINLLVYHGVFAPHARHRPEAVRRAQEGARRLGTSPGGEAGDAGTTTTANSGAEHNSRAASARPPPPPGYTRPKHYALNVVNSYSAFPLQPQRAPDRISRSWPGAHGRRGHADCHPRRRHGRAQVRHATARGGASRSKQCVSGHRFSVLRRFGAAAHSDTGCAIIPPSPACFTRTPVQDNRTGALVFYSTCDPVGENPNGGGQVFTMAPDGTALRQLTHTHGAVTEDDGSVDVELPGPVFYSVQDGVIG